MIPACESFIHALDFLDVESTERTTRMTHYSVREACEFLCATEKALDSIKPDAVIVLHQQNFWTRTLGYLADRRGIPVVSFQEGKLRRRDQQTLNKQATAADDCSKLLCWSESARQEYLEAGIPDSKLAVTGIPHLAEWFGYMAEPKNWQLGKKIQKQSLGFDPERWLVSFFPPLLSRYDGNPKTALGALADWSANNFTQLAIRLHPFEYEENVEKLKFGIKDHPYAKVIEKDTLPLIACSDVVISQHSTVAVETLALDVPLIEIDLDNVGVLESLAEQEVAIPMGGGELSKIKQVLNGELKVNPVKLQEWITQNVGPRDVRIVDRVVNEIERLL